MKLTLTGTQKEKGDAVSFFFAPEEPLTWEAGQYLHYLLPHENPDDRNTDRYFTISAAPFEKNVRITTRIFEKPSTFKAALSRLKTGESIEAENLEGDFTFPDASQEFVFISGGIGITPFRSILTEMDHEGLPIKGKLLYANRDNDFVFKEELEALAKKHPDFHIRYFVSPERIDEASIRAEVPDLSKPIFYVSGPAPMVFAFEKMLLSMGILPEHVKKDDFPGYDWP